VLAYYGRQGHLLGVECDWQQSGTWVKKNRITYSKNWPNQLDRLY
jgi:hypothetical protein